MFSFTSPSTDSLPCPSSRRLSRQPVLSALLAASIATFFSLSGASSLRAEDLVVPVGQQGEDKKNLSLPLRGQRAVAVEAEFGTPLNKSAPVGDPPISSWEYPEYLVYFEGDRVLHTVLKPMSPDAPETAPVETAPVETAPVETAPVETAPAN